MIGSIEVHSADGQDHIYHAEEHRWFVVWRGRRLQYPHRTRKLARTTIRGLKRFRPGTQLSFDFI